MKTALLIMSFLVCSELRHIAPLHTVATSESDESDHKEKMVEHAFRLYNPNVSDATIGNFIEISKAYGLYDDMNVFKKCIGQICLESGAKQNAVSDGNAMGMGQIVPSTAFHVLHNLSNKDQEKIQELKGEDVSWAIKGRYVAVEDSSGKRMILPTHLREKTKKWLKNERNNLILWAHIMSHSTNDVGFDNALLRYRMGKSAANNYGLPPKRHPYIRKIYKISESLFSEEGGH